jgi:glycerophosphoryl diester phosphodiesterase
MKKIVIFIITILVLGVLAMTSCIQNSKRIEQEKEKVATISNEIIDNNTEMSNAIQDDNIENQEQPKVENIVEEDENIKQETKTELADSKTINNSQSTIKDTETKISTDKQTVVNNSQQTNIASETKKEEQPEKQQETIAQTTQTESKNTENKVMTEELKRNDEMIAKIKSVIQNNVTEDMKNYGYEIVVDSSIKELTNQFTYTEQRVIDKITWKFGTIRIYAEDYYYNGQFIMTECYII